jgi:nucleoside-diphosphate-sugar epimerase
MTKPLAASELILNPDGSLYHCNLLPENLGDTVFLVGDPDRVPTVSAFFDTVDFKTQKREIVTHTGIKNGKKVMLAKVDKQYFRPLEVDYLKGDSKKAHKKLKFKPKYNLNSLIKEMIDNDLVLARKEARSKNY